ncbi:thiamine phosphate synthase [Shewanella waksmanii]|uniref:thiamine phosphate synthase n=1 Tax=Shewanella waksmanii TaxID=213783 RepID=UPI0037367765
MAIETAKVGVAKPIVWTIAGSDSGGGAGIQADLAAINALEAHGCSVITSLTAQNSVSVDLVQSVSEEMLLAQLDTLLSDLPPKAIKIGLLSDQQQLQHVANWLAVDLKDYQKRHDVEVAVIVDPVMVATSGDKLNLSSQLDFSPFKGLATLITPNYHELVQLTQPLEDMGSVIEAGYQLAETLQTNVLIKGGDNSPLWHTDYAQDLFICRSAKRTSPLHQQRTFLLKGPRVGTGLYRQQGCHGSGCTLSSAVAAVMAHGFVLHDAVVVAKAFITQGIECAVPLGQGHAPVEKTKWPNSLRYFPKIDVVDDGPWYDSQVSEFAACVSSLADKPYLGVYPVVDNVDMIASLLHAGARTIQLRIKQESDLENDPLLADKIAAAIELGKQFNARVFINDHWQQAIAHQAYGIHLGQEDLYQADLSAIAASGARLGLSSHGYFEALIALQVNPSYLALGHIFPTTTKAMPSTPQGIDHLQRYVQLFAGQLPLVAIGGIDLSNLNQVKHTKVDDIAVARAVTEADDPAGAYQALAAAWQEVS